MSLPFLVSWGLAISIFSVFSTLLLTPALTVFLLIASLIFFCELLHIPNTLFIWILEYITTAWLFFLSLSQQWWLIGFTKPPLMCLICIIPLTIAILHCKHIRTDQARITGLTILLLIICMLLKFFPYPHKIIEIISYNNHHIKLINHNNQLTVIDNGALGNKLSYESFVNYNLIPDIIQKTGKMDIEYLILNKINKRTLDAVTFLSTKMCIKNIYIPWWTDKIPLFAWSSYIKLKKTVSLTGGKIISISKKRSLFKTEHSFLFIEPNSLKSIRYYNATYSPLSLNGVINKENITI
jgi:hypothetical protein